MTGDHVEARLGELFESLKVAPFPRSPDDSRLDGQFATLVVYDGEIAGVVSRLLEGEVPPRHTLRALRRKPELERDLASYENSAQAVEYLQRLRELHEIVDLAQTLIDG